MECPECGSERVRDVTGYGDYGECQDCGAQFEVEDDDNSEDFDDDGDD